MTNQQCVGCFETVRELCINKDSKGEWVCDNCWDEWNCSECNKPECKCLEGEE